MGAEHMSEQAQARVSADELSEAILEIIRLNGSGDLGITPKQIMERLAGSARDLHPTREIVHRRLHDLRGRGLIRQPDFGMWKPVPQPVLRWDKPAQAEPYETWAEYQPDGGPPGAWVPNMSYADQHAWKAKLCGQKSGDLRTEVRKSVGPVQVKIVIYETGQVITSQNGTAEWTAAEWEQLPLAVAEAREAMGAWRREHP
jgi:hypothetical protein